MVLALDGAITAEVLLIEAMNGDGEGQQGDKDGIHFEQGGKNNSGNRGESKPSNKSYKNNKETNRNQFKPFGYDWLGRCFCLDLRAETAGNILMF